MASRRERSGYRQDSWKDIPVDHIEPEIDRTTTKANRLASRKDTKESMKTIHRTTIIAKCPHGGPDVYEAEFIIIDKMITVEFIQGKIDMLTDSGIYQEKLTQKLADLVGCDVVTKGTHKRFSTECSASPEPTVA